MQSEAERGAARWRGLRRWGGAGRRARGAERPPAGARSIRPAARQSAWPRDPDAAGGDRLPDRAPASSPGRLTRSGRRGRARRRGGWRRTALACALTPTGQRAERNTTQTETRARRAPANRCSRAARPWLKSAAPSSPVRGRPRRHRRRGGRAPRRRSQSAGAKRVRIPTPTALTRSFILCRLRAPGQPPGSRSTRPRATLGCLRDGPWPPSRSCELAAWPAGQGVGNRPGAPCAVTRSPPIWAPAGAACRLAQAPADSTTVTDVPCLATGRTCARRSSAARSAPPAISSSRRAATCPSSATRLRTRGPCSSRADPGDRRRRRPVLACRAASDNDSLVARRLQVHLVPRDRGRCLPDQQDDLNGGWWRRVAKIPVEARPSGVGPGGRGLLLDEDVGRPAAWRTRTASPAWRARRRGPAPGAEQHGDGPAVGDDQPAAGGGARRRRGRGARRARRAQRARPHARRRRAPTPARRSPSSAM